MYDWVQSHPGYCLPAGTYMMRLTRIGLGEGEVSRSNLDLVILQEAPNPVELISWGQIKALYKGD